MQPKRIVVDTINFDDNTEGFAPSMHEDVSAQPRISEAALILNRIQQSIRLLAGDMNRDSLEKVLQNLGKETEALAQIFSAKHLRLLSILSASVSKLVTDLSGDPKA